MKETTIHYGIYRYDRIVFLYGKWKNEDIKRCLSTFQLKANDLLDSEKLKFTVQLWSPSEKVSIARKYDNSVTVMTSPYFPSLDIETYWSKKDELHFLFHMK